MDTWVKIGKDVRYKKEDELFFMIQIRQYSTYLIFFRKGTWVDYRNCPKNDLNIALAMAKRSAQTQNLING